MIHFYFMELLNLEDKLHRIEDKAENITIY